MEKIKTHCGLTVNNTIKVTRNQVSGNSLKLYTHIDDREAVAGLIGAIIESGVNFGITKPYALYKAIDAVLQVYGYRKESETAEDIGHMIDEIYMQKGE